MSNKILIVGNVLKDIYLRLDERKEEIEHDETNTKWLNWGFNGSSHEFFRRTSVYSGAVVTLEVLRKFGIGAEIINEVAKVDKGGVELDEIKTANYRYILQAEDQISYLVPSEKTPTEFPLETLPAEYKWIFLDRSAVLSQALTEKLLKILDARKDVRFAFYVPKRITKPAIPLAERADLLFTDGDMKGIYPRGKVCFISETGVRIGKSEVAFSGLKKTDLLTHLTTYSIIAATLLGSALRGKTIGDSLLMARLNIENTKLDETVEFEKLEELVREEKTHGVDLRMMAAQIMARGKGILAADESGGSIHKKFEALKIPDDFAHRRDYREMLLTTPNLENYINGVILFDETARQKTYFGENFVDYLTEKGIIPGIKVDLGLKTIADSKETYTTGLEGLPERLEEYYEMGLRFAKWRAAFEISETTPTKNAVLKNVAILADYALLCQRARIVPIVEPEVVYDGDYSIEKCAAVTGIILRELFEELKKKEVQLNAVILKVNMILSGKKSGETSTPLEVGDWTSRVLRRFVPKEVAGVVFLSGGQTPTQATENLQSVTNQGPFPWPVSFSFARALQDPALEAWAGDHANAPKAQEKFLERLIANASALKKN